MLPRKGDPVIVQNITGRYGRLHTKLMLEYGTNIAAGATPGKAGQSVEGVPVYDTVAEAVDKTGSTASVLFVPAEFALVAGEEALRAGVKLLVMITEHVPVRDTLKLLHLAQSSGASMVGPNCPGLIVPSQDVKMGIMPAPSFAPGKVAILAGGLQRCPALPQIVTKRSAFSLPLALASFLNKTSHCRETGSGRSNTPSGIRTRTNALRGANPWVKQGFPVYQTGRTVRCARPHSL